MLRLGILYFEFGRDFRFGDANRCGVVLMRGSKTVLTFVVALMPFKVCSAAQPLGCLFEPERTADVGSPVIGIVATVDVERGAVVHKGQVLATLRSDVERASVNVANTRAKAEADVKTAEANLKLARVTQKRGEDLVGKNFISQQALDKSVAETAIAEQKLRLAQEQLDVWSSELGLARAQLGQRSIRSPIDGIVADRLVWPGERVDDKALFKIAKINPLRVEMVVPVTLYGTLTQGMQVSVTPDMPNTQPLQAKVVLVDKLVDGASNTFRIRAEIPNDDFAIPSGLRCKAELPDPPKVAAKSTLVDPLNPPVAKPAAVPTPEKQPSAPAGTLKLSPQPPAPAAQADLPKSPKQQVAATNASVQPPQVVSSSPEKLVVTPKITPVAAPVLPQQSPAVQLATATPAVSAQSSEKIVTQPELSWQIDALQTDVSDYAKIQTVAQPQEQQPASIKLVTVKPVAQPVVVVQSQSREPVAEQFSRQAKRLVTQTEVLFKKCGGFLQDQVAALHPREEGAVLLAQAELLVAKANRFLQEQMVALRSQENRAALLTQAKSLLIAFNGFLKDQVALIRPQEKRAVSPVVAVKTQPVPTGQADDATPVGRLEPSQQNHPSVAQGELLLVDFDEILRNQQNVNKQ